MRQVRFRAVITLDPATPGTVPPRPRHARGHRHHGPLPTLNPRSTAQTGPGALTAPADDASGQYLNRTHELMLRAESREKPGYYRSFAAELCWDEDAPLHPGDRHVVTVTLTDDDAPVFFCAGQRFTLWKGAEVGHGTISRRVFSEHGPC